jgi:hypothetical protein
MAVACCSVLVRIRNNLAVVRPCWIGLVVHRSRPQTTHASRWYHKNHESVAGSRSLGVRTISTTISSKTKNKKNSEDHEHPFKRLQVHIKKSRPPPAPTPHGHLLHVASAVSLSFVLPPPLRPRGLVGAIASSFVPPLVAGFPSLSFYGLQR